MNVNRLITYRDVLDVLKQLVVFLDTTQRISHFNERYLHHFFSHYLQMIRPITFDGQSLIHPEWATSKDGTLRNVRYKDAGQRYEVSQECGSSGYIDLAIGDINRPSFAIEFKMTEHINSKGIEYDYLKLLDGRNSFEKGLSIIVLYGRSRISKSIYKNLFPTCVANAIMQLREKHIPIRKDFVFFVLEHHNGKTVIHCCDTPGGLFSSINSI